MPLPVALTPLVGTGLGRASAVRYGGVKLE